LALWTWIATTATVAAGVVLLALTPLLGLTGLEMLIGPLIIAGGLTASAVLAGLRSPWGVLILFLGVEAVFIILKFLNPWGLGSVL